MKKSFIFVTVSLTLVFACMLTQLAAAQQESPTSVKEAKSVEKYQMLMEFMNGNEAEDLNNVYSGAYIDEDKNLNINITNDCDQVKESIWNVVGNENVIINKVNFTFGELKSKYDILSSLLGQSPYYSVELSETNNNVNVFTENKTECINFLKENTDDLSAINVVEQKNNIKDCASVYAGSSALNRNVEPIVSS